MKTISTDTGTLLVQAASHITNPLTSPNNKNAIFMAINMVRDMGRIVIATRTKHEKIVKNAKKGLQLMYKKEK